MSDQKAVKPDWKVSTIPKNASNATEPLVASTKELEEAILNPRSIQQATPLESDEIALKTTELNTVPRFNANLPYTPQPIVYSMNDQILMQAIRVAVANGWNDYHRIANGAVTIGMEAEAVIDGMKRRNDSIEGLVIKKDFCRYLWPKTWQTKLPEMIMSDNLLKYMEGHLKDE